MTRATHREWVRTATTPRMLLLLVAFLAVAALFARLGAWQLDRAAIRGAAADRAVAAERLAADPVPLADVLRVGQDFLTDQQLVKVEAHGEFREQVLVPDRVVAGQPAVLVVTALWIDGGALDGTMIPVLRGWLPAEAVTTTDGAVAADAATARQLAVPAGPVDVIGHLTDSEQALAGAHPEGMVGAISTAQLANLWGGPTFTGFLVALDGGPLPAVPPPSYGQVSGLNLQNLAYAGEWFLFGGFALALWGWMVRAQAVRGREAALLTGADRDVPAGGGD